MLNIGCHLSSSKGFLAMGKTASEIGANTFQFFTRNPRGSKAKDIDSEDAKALVSYMEANGFGKILAHAPYTLNPAGADQKVRDFAEMVMKDDLIRMEHVPGSYYNFHPGSHVGQGLDEGVKLISDLLNRLLSEEQTTIVLLETMAGKGTEVGRTFASGQGQCGKRNAQLEKGFFRHLRNTLQATNKTEWTKQPVLGVALSIWFMSPYIRSSLP